MCWQYLDLGPSRPDAAVPARLMRSMCDAYGLHDRSLVVETVLWWQDRCWRGIDARADEGDPAMVRLRQMGGVRWVRGDYEWVIRNRDELEAALRRATRVSDDDRQPRL